AVVAIVVIAVAATCNVVVAA
ncbi:hypothetical protein A2U01_0066976, partial [Trifolium medium]|nr:hypothetical protein [Trifolium medium]